MKAHFIRCILVILLSCSMLTVFGQKRSLLVKSINEWGNCRNVTITASKGNIAMSDKNAYAISGELPKEMYDAIVKAAEDKKNINDMVLTEGGAFLVLTGENGYVAKNIPLKLNDRLKEMNSNKEKIISVSFNDKGDWIVISSAKVAGMITGIDNLQSIADKNGRILTAFVSNKGVAIVCQNGVYLKGEFPEILPDVIKKITFPIYRVKFAEDGSYFIADKEGTCSFGL